MDKPQMMICPKAEGCKKTCEEPDHKHPHIQNKECQYGSCVHRIACGVCIPYEPSPVKCEALGCDKPAVETLVSSTFPSISFNLCKEHAVQYVEPSSPKDKCPDCNGTGINPEKFPDARCPCTQSGMPLICANCGVEDAGICEGHECAGRQRDADMAWHLEKVLQVRKDFAEEWVSKSNELQAQIIELLQFMEEHEDYPNMMFLTVSSIIDKVRTHLREMAEGGR